MAPDTSKPTDPSAPNANSNHEEPGPSSVPETTLVPAGAGSGGPTAVKPDGDSSKNRHGKKPKLGGHTWAQIQSRARTASSIIGLFVFILAIGGASGYVVSQSRQKPAATPKTTVENLSPSDISKLTEIGSNLGTSGQTLNIGANALFRGKIDVGGDLSVGGRFNANGPVTLSQLNISGSSALSGLSVGSNLAVSGQATFNQGITVQSLASFNGSINVAGSASFNALNAASIAVRNISISGPLTISHLATQGPAPAFVPGTALGGGGTANLSGNDTAGTININTGSAPPAGILGSISFRAAYGATVHVLLSPITGAAASTSAYVTRSATGFQIRTDVAPPAGASLSFDYLVVQ